MHLLSIAEEIISFCEAVMPIWITYLSPIANDRVITIDAVHIRRVIYQGGSLSPLLFFIAMAPLSTLLKEQAATYNIHKTKELINHMIYKDDLKYISSNQAQLQALIELENSALM